MKRLFGDHAYKLSMSSTKSAIGHLLGAAGAVEAVFSIKAIETGGVPPTLNLENPSEGCDLDLVAKEAKERPSETRCRILRIRRNERQFGFKRCRLVRDAAHRSAHSSRHCFLYIGHLSGV